MKRSLLLGICLSVVVATLVIGTKTNAVSSVFAVITCATTAACNGGNNTDGGPGVLGQSKSQHGVIGRTLFNSTNPSNGESAVFGQDLSTSGVYDMGVQGVSVRGYGVRGRSSENAGVRGDATTGFGLEGTSTSNVAVYGNSTQTLGVDGVGGSEGVQGNSSAFGVVGFGGTYGLYGQGTSYGSYAFSSAGHGAVGASTSGFGLVGQSQSFIGIYANGGTGNGSDISGQNFGLLGRSTKYPLVLTDLGGRTVFYVDGSGDVFYHGTLNQFSAVGGATEVPSYTRATAPAIEETGTSHLSFGEGRVYFSPSFARAVDPRYGYQVFLTPGADTRGLYVAAKYAGGFVVREVQAGRGSFNFDYHVYAATARSSATEAMRAVPSAPIVAAPAMSVQPQRIAPAPDRP